MSQDTLVRKRTGKHGNYCDDMLANSRSGLDWEHYAAQYTMESRIKDAVYQVFEHETRRISDIEARAIARQLSIAFSDAARAMDD